MSTPHTPRGEIQTIGWLRQLVSKCKNTCEHTQQVCAAYSRPLRSTASVDRVSTASTYIAAPRCNRAFLCHGAVQVGLALDACAQTMTQACAVERDVRTRLSRESLTELTQTLCLRGWPSHHAVYDDL